VAVHDSAAAANASNRDDPDQPSGLQITAGGVAQSTPYSWTCSGGSLAVGVTSPQSGGAGIQYVYGSWSDSGAQSHSIACPGSNATYTVNFTAQYYLTMTAGAGGSVSPASGWYNSGAGVSISAAPSAGYSFSGWSGSGSGSYSGTSQSTSVTMHGPISETASFTAAPTTVTIQTSPGGLQITAGGVAQATPYSWTCSGGSIAVGVPSPQSGGTGTQYVYGSWSDGGAQSHSIACPSSSTTYTANFTTQYYLTMAAGAGGSVSPASGWYNSGAGVSISAAPSAGYSFSGWSGSGSGTSQSTSVTMSGPISETASFTPTQTTVTIQTSPAGLQIAAGGVTENTPYYWTCSGGRLSVGVPRPQSEGSRTQ